MENINWLALIISVIVTMGIGFWWYSKAAFGNLWMKLKGTTQEEMAAAGGPGMGGTMACAVIAQVIIIGAYDFVLSHTLLNPFCISALVVVGFIAPLLAGASIWERQSWKLFWLHMGHWVAAFVAVAIIYTLL